MNLETDYVDINREDVNKIMWMWMSGIAIRAISNYFNKTDSEINAIIDAYQDAYI